MVSGADSDLAAGPASIGRYFTVVSLIPALAFVSFMRWQVEIGALGNTVDPGRVAGIGVGQVATTAAAGLALALALNPLQFGLIQLFEGYWGVSRIALVLQAHRIAHHRRRSDRLNQWTLAGDHAIRRSVPRTGGSPGQNVLTSMTLAAESVRLRHYYPESASDVHATRLGNVLRRYERMVGRAYGLDLITMVPRVAMVAGERELDYLQNQRTQLELAIRTCFLGLLASVLTVAVMLRHGLWMLLALAPYVVAFLAYRGAVILAHEYCSAMTVLLELNRFVWYERMGVHRPESARAERTQNAALMRALNHEPDVDLAYPPPSA